MGCVVVEETSRVGRVEQKTEGAAWCSGMGTARRDLETGSHGGAGPGGGASGPAGMQAGLPGVKCSRLPAGQGGAAAGTSGASREGWERKLVRDAQPC